MYRSTGLRTTGAWSLRREQRWPAASRMEEQGGRGGGEQQRRQVQHGRRGERRQRVGPQGAESVAAGQILRPGVAAQRQRRRGGRQQEQRGVEPRRTDHGVTSFLVGVRAGDERQGGNEGMGSYPIARSRTPNMARIPPRIKQLESP